MKKLGRAGLSVCWLIGCSSSPLASAVPDAGNPGSAGNSSSAGNSDSAGNSSSAGYAGGAGYSGYAGGAGTGQPESRCAAARAAALGANDTVSPGNVTVVSRTAGVTTLYVDATAGGMADAPNNPWTFISLAEASKVEVTDVTAIASSAWDMAFKRAQIFTNGGDGGPGSGAAARLDKAFDDVTSADARDAAFSAEVFFDADCTPNVALTTGALYTTFIEWYSYDEVNHVITPESGTYLVRGGTGKLYKVAFESYYGTETGETGSVGGAYLLKFKSL